MNDGSLPPSPPTADYATQPPASDGDLSNTRIDRYKLLEQIGEGGFGVVYVAEQTEPIRRKVALKVIKPGMDSREVIARFEAERHALALMDHPNIAKVFDAGQCPPMAPGGVGSRPYFVMELVKGIAITQFCDRNRLSPRERLELFMTVCQAIQHAHQKGVIHRDIKPSNVLVALQDGKPVAKVIDFGVAKALHQKLSDHSIYTGIAQMIGTPLYMSPEQAEMTSLDIDTRSDIYSLGVLLYELLTGATPFDKQRFAKAAFDEIRRVIREEEPPKPSTRLSGSASLASVSAQRRLEPAKLSKLIRGDLDWITMKCLEKDRGRRYETANGLAMDIQRYLADEPVAAGPPSAAYRMRKFVRRNCGAVIAAGLVILALAGGVVGTSIGLIQANHARHRALTRLVQLEKSNDILASIFTNLDPRAAEKDAEQLHVILGRQLEQAAQQLQGETVGDRLMVAKIQTALGKSLVSLGHPQLAISVLQKAETGYDCGLGDSHADKLRCRCILALAYRDAGQLENARPLFEATPAALERALGTDHPDTIVSRANLAEWYCDCGDFDKAITLYLATIQQLERVRGTDHKDTLGAQVQLARAYKYSGQVKKALPLFERALISLGRTQGADHPDTLMAKNNYANALRDVMQFDKAILLLEQTLKAQEVSVGKDHRETLVTRTGLAVAYWEAEKPELAVPLFEQNLKAFANKLGPDHPDTIIARSNVAMVCKDLGKNDEALLLLAINLKAVEAKSGPDHVDALGIRERIGQASLAKGDHQTAIQNLKNAREGFALKSGREHSSTLSATDILVQAYLAAAQFADAETAGREWLEIVEKLKPGQWTHHRAQSMVGAALIGQKRFVEAEPLVLGGYEGMKRRQDRVVARARMRELPKALGCVIELYEATGKPDEAAKWKKELEGLPKAGDDRRTNN